MNSLQESQIDLAHEILNHPVFISAERLPAEPEAPANCPN